MCVPGLMVLDAEFDGLAPDNWTVVGRISQSSNNALLVSNNGIKGVYKSVRGENPLWDFPSQTLSLREMQAFQIDRLLQFNLIPSTTWIDTDTLGPGIIQRYISDSQVSDIRLISEDVESDSWITIVKGEIDEEEIYLQHSNKDDTFLAAVFDVLINNSDRKAGHLLRDNQSKLWLIDHGVSFHEEDKLRTVLWGWIGEPISSELKQTLTEALERSIWRDTWLLSESELEAFERRVETLLTDGMPQPSPFWPSLPSPIF